MAKATVYKEFSLGFYHMQRGAGDHDEIFTVSFRESEDAVRAFAGDDISRAVFYPKDDAWLVSPDLHADHCAMVGDVRATAPSSDTRHPANFAG